MKSAMLVGIWMSWFSLAAPVADSIDIQSLNEQKKRWPQWAQERKTIVLEGRFASRAGSLLRMQRTDVVFRMAKGVQVPRVRANKNIEVVGYLVGSDDEFSFVVTRIGLGSSDVDTLESKRRRLPNDNPQAWYDLAKWGQRRAAFYEDAKLLREAQETRAAGFRIEVRAVKDGDADGLRKLADRTIAMGGSEATRAEMIHRSLRWRWRALSKDKKVDRDAFLKLLAKDLKGAKDPVRLGDVALQRAYAKQPLSTYSAAKFSDRLHMDRYFYREIRLPMLLATARADGRNGSQIAALLRKEIPEESELAESFEQKELDWRYGNVEKVSRAEMLDLVDLLERNKQRARALEAKRRWVDASATLLRSRGPAGLVQAASEYDTLLGDRAKAVRLLKQAWEKSSEKSEIEQRLQKYGLYRQSNRWLTREELDDLPENVMERAQKEGRVVKGMTLEQVRKTLGKPNRESRFSSGGKIQIVWIFGESSTPLSVLFERRHLKSTEAKVQAVITLPRR